MFQSQLNEWNLIGFKLQLNFRSRRVREKGSFDGVFRT
jgi:hypothetical protein